MNTQKQESVFLYVPDGIGVRNYLYSDLMSKLAAVTKVGMYHALPSFVIDEVQKAHQQPIECHVLPAFSERRIERTLRDLCMLSRLMRNSRIRKNERIWKSFVYLKNAKGIWKFYFLILIGIARIIAQQISWIEKLDAILNRQYLRGNSGAAPLRALLQATKPGVIVCTHQRVPQAALMAEVARELNIPFVTAIFSWDNLPKSRITPKAHKYMVWSSYMQQEMAWYYPGIAAKDIVITGTPQFECYAKTSLYQTREDFLAQWQLPKQKPLVLLSGNDMASPNDHYYFEDIAEAIMTLPEAERPHLVLRRSPVDASGRFDGFAQKYASILTSIDPIWTTAKEEKDGFGSLPKLADVALLTNLCLHCDLVVNIGSTMGLDFAHFGKPAVYIHYQKPYNTDWYDIDFIYGLEHFRTLDGLDAVLWIKSTADILPVITAGLKRPQEVATQREAWKQKLTNNIPDASDNITKLLLQLAAGKA